MNPTSDHSSVNTPVQDSRRLRDLQGSGKSPKFRSLASGHNRVGRLTFSDLSTSKFTHHVSPVSGVFFVEMHNFYFLFLFFIFTYSMVPSEASPREWEGADALASGEGLFLVGKSASEAKQEE